MPIAGVRLLPVSMCLLALLFLSGAREAGAQPLGSFSWQLQPFCNRVTLNVVQTGAVYTMDGWDDQCGAATRAPIVGSATLNPNGTIGFGLTITTTPGGVPVTVDAAITIASLGGTWRDSAGHTGVFAFGAATGGSPRPPTVNGDITAVAAGTGLTGGGSSGDVSLAVDFGSSGFATTVARSDHAHEVPGEYNTAVGPQALAVNQTGIQNTAVGGLTLTSNTTGMSNTASGMAALFLNTTGSENTGFGAGTLTYSETGSQNTAVGFFALVGDPNNYNTGSRNTAIGVQALGANTSGEYNTASGYQALNLNTSGTANIGIGFGAGPTLTTGNTNILIGSGAGATLVSGNSNIYIGSGGGGANESNTMRLGASQSRTFISGIRGVTTGLGGAVAVVIDASGQLGTVSSSRRTKDHIEDLGAVSRAIFDLRPVQFTYKQAFAGGPTPMQYGLIAEEVEAVLPELVAYNAAGEVETVQYHVLPTLLLAEVQRLERERTAMADELAELRAGRTAMAEALAELRAAVAALSRPRR